MSSSSSDNNVVYLLTGDIGGTNSRMSLYTTDERIGNNAGGATKPTITKTFRNSQQYVPESVLEQDNAFIEYVLKPFLFHCWEEEHVHQVSLPKFSSTNTTIVCCIASAGVVSDNQVRLTNLGNLLISGKMIQEDSSNDYMKAIVRCLIINDFVAQGYGCLTLRPHEVQHLYGPANFEAAKGPKACVGAGTGLGECFLTQSEHQTGPKSRVKPYSCFPSEGGHVEFAPRNALEVELLEYLSEKFGTKSRISVERVVSGKGLANVYEFLSQKFPYSQTPHVQEAFLKAGDEQGRVVAENASRKDGTACPLCQQAMSIMISAYGCEVGSAAIKWIPTGGLFVSGGLTPKNIQYIQGLQSDFMTSYRNKGRVSPMLERVPLYAVLTEDLGVRGAHHAARAVYDSYCAEHGIPKKDSSTNRGTTFTQRISSLSTSTLIIAAAASMGMAVATAATVTLLGGKR